MKILGTSIFVLTSVIPLMAQARKPEKHRMINPGVSTRMQAREGERILAPVSPGATAKALDEIPPGALPVGSAPAAERQDYILNEAVRVFGAKNRKPDDRSITGHLLSPTIDPVTGLVKEDADELSAELNHKPYTKEPDGTRARLAELAGFSPAEIAKIFPEDGKSYASRDLKYFSPKTQEEVEKALVPKDGGEREVFLKNAVLTDAEASFATYATLGLPLPIRVGKVNLAGTTGEGLVLFSPELLRADTLNDQWTPLRVSYRFMNGTEEVSKDIVEVKPFLIIRKPNYPASHLWITCDKDVMIYALRGVSMAPTTIAQAREQIQADVVPVNSWSRVATQLYGIRWGVLPGPGELTKNKATREKLMEVMTETGLLQASQEPEPNPLADEMRRLADQVKTLPAPHLPKGGKK